MTIKVIDFEAGQKLADTKGLLLIIEGFDLDGTKLDLYGTCSDGEYLVEDVTIAHTRISIFELLSSIQVAYLDSKCNADRPSEKERLQDLRADAYAMQHG